jgi:hypothetical protein
MRKMLFICSFMAACCFGQSATGQEIIKQQTCNVAAFQQQIDSVKTFFSQKGFRLLRESSMQMESQYEMPVVFPLNEKQRYSFVFIGDPKSRLFEVRFFDIAEAPLYYEKKLSGDHQANVILFPFTPVQSNYFVLKALQIQKGKKDICSYVMVFKE